MSAEITHESAFNQLLQECFWLNRSIIEAAQQLTAGADITGAQWGVLTAFGHGEQPRTVADTARRMGLTRQSVQRVADVLADRELVRYRPSQTDRRTKLVEVTQAGRTLLTKLDARQRHWATKIGTAHAEQDLARALRLVKEIREQITQQAGG